MPCRHHFEGPYISAEDGPRGPIPSSTFGRPIGRSSSGSRKRQAVTSGW